MVYQEICQATLVAQEQVLGPETLMLDHSLSPHEIFMYTFVVLDLIHELECENRFCPNLQLYVQVFFGLFMSCGSGLSFDERLFFVTRYEFLNLHLVPLDQFTEEKFYK